MGEYSHAMAVAFFAVAVVLTAPSVQSAHVTDLLVQRSWQLGIIVSTHVRLHTSLARIMTQSLHAYTAFYTEAATEPAPCYTTGVWLLPCTAGLAQGGPLSKPRHPPPPPLLHLPPPRVSTQLWQLWLQRTMTSASQRMRLQCKPVRLWRGSGLPSPLTLGRTAAEHSAACPIWQAWDVLS